MDTRMSETACQACLIGCLLRIYSKAILRHSLGFWGSVKSLFGNVVGANLEGLLLRGFLVFL